jgi:hypothetical protein
MLVCSIVCNPTRMKINKACCALLLIAALSVCPTSRATLIGDTITATGPGGLLPSSTAIIGAGIEFTGVGVSLTSVSFDFGANTLTLLPAPGLGAITGNNIFFTFSDFADTITGITVEANAGWSGSILTPTFGAHNISLNFSSIQINTVAPAPRALVFNIQSLPSVPDRGVTVAMLGLALTGLALGRRKLLD